MSVTPPSSPILEPDCPMNEFKCRGRMMMRMIRMMRMMRMMRTMFEPGWYDDDDEDVEDDDCFHDDDEDDEVEA